MILKLQLVAGPQGCIVCNLTMHFCKRFPHLKPMTFWSHDNNFTRHPKAPFQSSKGRDLGSNVEVESRGRVRISNLWLRLDLRLGIRVRVGSRLGVGVGFYVKS
ncbi:hypothetical protein H5410_026559 [Solanum commersonii]|uniref:Uncharacterized protein n=1 Tax=Solanum commersonii TaxID=4109 RepID=A0A9J5YWH0_SOLCO|nr:hypothetical protein H5410_026559 [Solanum commersonii]